MPRSDADAIETIKARLDLADLVRRYIELKPAGERWVGVCPFHQETKPSFSVNPQLGFYYCFGCQASGDVIDFYRQINGLDFREALEELARETGVELTSVGGQGRRSLEQRKAMLEMHALAQEFYHRTLQGNHGRTARAYLAKRGIDRKMVEQFGIGLSPDDWHGLENHLRRHGFSKEQGVKAGLLSQNQKGNIYDRFRGRIMFPICDLSGKVIAFGARVLGEGEPKYLNSSDTPIYKKGDHLYGLYQARTAVTQVKEVLLTEGYTDVISLARFGFVNACGVLGTSLTQDQIKRLAGFCRSVALVFDGDRAGREAARRSAEMILLSGIACRVVELPEGEDIDTFLQHQGAASFEDLLETSNDGLAFCLQMISKNLPPKEIMDWAMGFLQGLWDQSWRAYYLPKIAKGLELSEAELRKSLRKKDGGGRQLPSHTSDTLRCGTAQRDRELLRFVVCHPEYLEQLRCLGLEQTLGTERAKSFWDKIGQHGVGNDLLSVLDEGEKRFFVQCRMEEAAEESSEEQWQDVQDLLERCRMQDRKKTLRTALSEAQRRGDEAEVARLLKAYTDVMGEPNE